MQIKIITLNLLHGGKYFEEIAENTPDDIIRNLIKKADEWMDGTAQADDITFVVVKVK